MEIKIIKDYKPKNFKKEQTYFVANDFGKKLLKDGFAIDVKNPSPPKETKKEK